MKIFLNILAFLLFALGAVAVFGWAAYQNEVSRPVVLQKQIFIINKGDSVKHIIFNLKRQKVEIKLFWFKFMGYNHKVIQKLKAGEYELKPGLTTPQLLLLFASGKSRQYAITFPEGFSFKQMLAKMLANKHLKQTLSAVDNKTLMARLQSDYKHPEGLFFPDTYFFSKNATDFSILKKAHAKMAHVLKNQWENKEEGLEVKTPYETLILASIIEKETAVASERTLISGVFSRRLKIGMLLQTDPTVIYGMGDRYQGNIRYKDLREATAYNTYVIKGLPPTPIAMPGKEAIYAALHPSKGESLYFVANGNGTHIFSANLNDHNNAVNRYQRSGKK
jgi:UPF0755 protein